jgi:hypothetical protein
VVCKVTARLYKVKYVRTQRVKRWGHLNRMGKNKNSEEGYGMEYHRNEM